MQRSLLILVIWLGGLSAQAQSPYFIYLQAEPAQSFTVNYKEKSFPSSASGYVILPNLIDSVLQLVVRFSEQKNLDHSFTVNTQRSDQGYLLKDYGDKGWGLLDWRTLTVSYAERPAVAKSNRITVAGQSDFATLLAKASGDSTLLLDDSTPAHIINNKSVVAADQRVSGDAKSDTTIVNKSAAIVKPADEVKPDTTIATKPAALVKPADEVKPPANERPAPVSKPAVVPIPSYCKSILSDAEFNECLSKVQAARSETSKINVLREFMGGRCYTIDQVKALALLLTTDEVRYDFLLEAWTQTVERSRYLMLATVFSSPATADRFKEMFQ
jgi:hypothetical protein